MAAEMDLFHMAIHSKPIHAMCKFVIVRFALYSFGETFPVATHIHPVDVARRGEEYSVLTYFSLANFWYCRLQLPV